MKLLLKKNIKKLGIVGDIVDVADGYGRNYLLPQGLATEPTESNMRALAEARRLAEEERERERAHLAEVTKRIDGIEVTIPARANAEGVLYGSVSKKEIADALNAEGHEIEPEHVLLKDPLKRLDNVLVPVRLIDEFEAEVKVWVVREKIEGEEEPTDEGVVDGQSETVEEPEAIADGDESGEDKPE